MPKVINTILVYYNTEYNTNSKATKMKITDIINEGLKNPKDNPCWKGYHPVGTKKKNGKTVPNCVPKESVEEANNPAQQAAIAVNKKKKQSVAEADKHSVIGKIQRGHELKKKVDSSWKDIGKAQKAGDKKTGSKAFRKHERYANLERPGTWTKVDEEGVAEGSQNEQKYMAVYNKFMENPSYVGKPITSGGNVIYVTASSPAEARTKFVEIFKHGQVLSSFQGRYNVVPAKQENISEAENWSKHNNPKAGGMSKKSVSVYRREHPGSKIQTAVTKKPSKIKKGSSDDKRRKSFCARMKGMKKHNTSSKTAHDPNSNINKSLRRWHCESVEDLQNLVHLAEQFIKNNRK